jgi:hypothetical protein
VPPPLKLIFRGVLEIIIIRIINCRCSASQQVRCRPKAINNSKPLTDFGTIYFVLKLRQCEVVFGDLTGYFIARP